MSKAFGQLYTYSNVVFGPSSFRRTIGQRRMRAQYNSQLVKIYLS